MKISVFIAILVSWAIISQAQMTLTGEIKTRTELRHGYQATLDSAQKGSVFTSQRSRLNFGYAADKFRTLLTMQDIRTWGSQSQLVSSYPDAPSFIHEAWAQYWCHSKFSVKVGRQALSYDDERLFGNTDWALAGRVHDVFLAIFEDTTSRFSVHAGLAYNQDKESNLAIPYSIAKSYKEMHYLWLNKKFNALSTSIILINHGSQSPNSIGSTRFFQTAGTFLGFKKNKLSLNGRFYYQTGIDASKKDMNAWMGGADVIYDVTDNIMIGLGAEMMSGQSQLDTTKAYRDVNHTFNTLYGTAHKFNGYMDYYFAGSAHGNVGLNDIYLKAKYKAKSWWIMLDVHQFMSASDVLDLKELNTSGNYKAMSSDLGTEIDLTFAYNFSKIFTAQFGYSHYLTSETIAYLKGATDYQGVGYTGEVSNWAYVMLTFKPNFMK